MCGVNASCHHQQSEEMGAQEPGACAVVLSFVTSSSVLGLVFAREGQGGERKVQMGGGWKLSRITRELSTFGRLTFLL